MFEKIAVDNDKKIKGNRFVKRIVDNSEDGREISEGHRERYDTTGRGSRGYDLGRTESSNRDAQSDSK